LKDKVRIKRKDLAAFLEIALEMGADKRIDHPMRTMGETQVPVWLSRFQQAPYVPTLQSDT
jgi:hypothetical protein